MRIIDIDYGYRGVYVTCAGYPLVSFHVFNYNNAPFKRHYTFSVWK